MWCVRNISCASISINGLSLHWQGRFPHSLFLSVLLAAWHRICKSFWPCTLVHRWAGLILVRGGGSRWWSTASSRTKSHQSGSQSSRDWSCRRLVNRMSSYSIWRLKKSFEALVILFSLRFKALNYQPKPHLKNLRKWKFNYCVKIYLLYVVIF